MLRKLIDSPWTYFVLAGLLLVLGVFSQLRPAGEDAPPGEVADIASLAERDDLNLIFILIDTLRADRLSAYGYERKTSPNLDALAARGIRFASVESQSSWTKASMASMWTARYPERTGVTRAAHAIPAEAMLPAELLRDAGYRTAGVWRNGWVANNFGFGQGFDLYYKPAPDRSPDSIRRRSPSAHRIQGTDLDVTQSAIEFIMGHRNERFLLYMHYMDVHQYLYNDVSPSWGTGFSDIYDSAIHWTDQNIGLLVEALHQEELLGRTVIVIASDHGEAFFEHGSEGHGRNLYGEVQQVPLIIVPPFALEEGVVVEEPVANIDIWPTLLDMMGLPPLPGAEGRSLLPLVLDRDEDSEKAESLRDRALFAQLDRGWGKRKKASDRLISMLDDSHRFIFRENLPEKSEVYDLSVDPDEQENLLTDGDDRAADLHAKVDEFLQAGPPSWGEAPEVEVDEMMLAQLRALGYVFTMTNREEALRRKRLTEEAKKHQKWEQE